MSPLGEPAQASLLVGDDQTLEKHSDLTALFFCADQAALKKSLQKIDQTLKPGEKLYGVILNPSNPAQDYTEGALLWSEWRDPRLYQSMQFPTEGEPIQVHRHHKAIDAIEVFPCHYFSAGTLYEELRAAGFVEIEFLAIADSTVLAIITATKAAG